MKKISYLLCLFVLLSAFTCENEPLEGDFVNEDIDNPGGGGDVTLVGTWALVDFTADINTQTSFGGIDFVVDFLTEATDSDYILEFTETSYTVNGDYELTSSTTVNGETTSYTDSYTDVSGSGVYSTDGNEMTVDGSFFELDVDGVEMEVLQGEQTATYELSADGQTLTFSQNDVETQNEGGAETTTIIVSESVWQKVE
ncbi:hypothetical protein [uncultured Psychroserpens sp.]|uniref:hypothetical protein n=1 Tax=uncultured Psychroserpens sp. TaxID=255436 RepID=UPI002635DE8C|nr:hypothetical protein [uncultured Psychroserpens sp.]